MTFHTVIKTIPPRIKHATYLSQRFHGEIQMDSEMKITPEYSSYIHNETTAFGRINPQTTHLLISEDDVEYPEYFEQTLSIILSTEAKNYPIAICQAQALEGKFKDAISKGYSWFSTNGPRASCSLLFPNDLSLEFSNWMKQVYHPPTPIHIAIDQWIGYWLMGKKIPLLVTVPELGVHLPGPSQIYNCVHPKYDKFYVKGDPRKINWHLGLSEALEKISYVPLRKEIKEYFHDT